jgi:hypothetical protein
VRVQRLLLLRQPLQPLRVRRRGCQRHAPPSGQPPRGDARPGRVARAGGARARSEVVTAMDIVSSGFALL